jgi:hypothetical protein
MLGKYTSTAMNLATSRIRVYGKVASPSRLSFEELEERRRLEEETDTEIPQLPLNDSELNPDDPDSPESE